MAEQQQQPGGHGRLSHLISRATDKLPPVSALPHLARQQGVRLDPRVNDETRALHALVKACSGPIQDRSSLAREQQIYAKSLYLWSKDDDGDDVVDVCDRLAFLMYKSSEIEQEAANKLEQARLVLKDIRNFENDLVPRRRNQHNLGTRISLLQKEAGAATSKQSNRKFEDQIAKLQAELTAVAAENATFEASFAVVKRTKLHESFSLQFEAQKELGEKLALIAGYGELLLQGMETDGTGADYEGKERTARVKAGVEDALKSWSPTPGPHLQEVDRDSLLDRSDTRSFADTHATALSEMDDTRSETSAAIANATVARATPHLAQPPPLATLPSQAELELPSRSSPSGTSGKRAVPPPPLPPHPRHLIDEKLVVPPPLPARKSSSATSPSYASPPGINLSPTPRPVSSELGSPPTLRAQPVPPEYGLDGAPRDPTVAETGAPKVGTGGPASGTLRPRRPSSSTVTGSAPEVPADTAEVTEAAEAVEAVEAVEAAEAAEAAAAASVAPPVLAPEPQAYMPGTFDEAGWNTAGRTEAGAVGADGEQLPQYEEAEDEAARARARAEAILAEEQTRKNA